MSSNEKQHKKKPNYAWRGQNQHAHKSKFAGQSMAPGMKGFICTYNDLMHEKQCMRDANNLLNEFADNLYGPEPWRVPETKFDKTVENEDSDIDAALEAEVAALKNQTSQTTSRRFQVVGCDVRGIQFIKTTVDNPVELGHRIVSSIAETKAQRSKIIMRLIPVQVTCKANHTDIINETNKLLPLYFSDGNKTFSIIFSHKLNDTVKRAKIIEDLAVAVVALNDTNKVDLSSPDLVIMVDVLRKVCCISVLPDYFKLKKYNILELCVEKENESKDVDEPAGNTEEKDIGEPTKEDSTLVDPKEDITAK